jgi:hypothetical protein
MDLVQWILPADLQSIPAEARALAPVKVSRGHPGARRPYSVPFTYSIVAPDYFEWWAWIDFDQLHAPTDYNGPQLLARFLANLRCTAEGKTHYDDASDPATWRAVFETCYSPDDTYRERPPEDMQSRRAEFSRKSLAELADAEPAEFLAYEIQTVTSANTRRTDMRSEFRIVSRPDASHRWLFWTHSPTRIAHDPAELAYWFERHVAQLRGARKPRWSAAQRDRWLDHIHRQVTGKTAAELKLDALAASPDKKPDVGLLLGGEEAAGGVRRWLIPRAAFSDARWVGADLSLSFTDADDRKPKTVTLSFRSVAAARTTICEILNGERRRLGVGPALRGIIGVPADDSFIVTVGLSEIEGRQLADTYILRHGPNTSQFRIGLLFQIMAPYRALT